MGSRETEAEHAESKNWIDYYKAHRSLLLDGDLVRVDHPDTTVFAHGVVAQDRSAAIFLVAAFAQSEVSSPGLLRFPGLDPDRSYRIRPVLPGGAWAEARSQPARIAAGLPEKPDYFAAAGHGSAGPSVVAHGDGLVLSGRSLAASGVQGPALSPEQAMLFQVGALQPFTSRRPDRIGSAGKRRGEP